MRPMGRRRTKHHGLPPLMHFRRGTYSYGRNDVPLGRDFATALRRYAELHGGEVTGVVLFSEAMARFLKDRTPGLARKTANEYARQSVSLVKVFGAVPLDKIATAHVYRYVEARGRTVAATREKALLSAVFNHARMVGFTTAANPCVGIRGISSRRDRLVSGDELAAALEAAKDDAPLAAYLELAYRTGQRPSDVLRMTRADVQDGALRVRQAKTGRWVRIIVEGPLEALLARLMRGTVGSVRLIRDERGQPLTLSAMRKRWKPVREALGTDWQLRDLRPKAASDAADVASARALLGHADEATTAAIYRRVGELARPVNREIAGSKR